MRKNIYGIAFAVFSVFARPVAAQGIPVFDGTAIGQWALQLEAMAEQYGISLDELAQTMKMVSEAEQMKRSLQDRLESALNIDAVGDLNDLKGTLDQARATVGAVQGMAGSAQDLAQRLQSTFGSDFGDATGLPTFSSVMKTTKDTVRGALVTSGATLDRIPTDAVRINELVRQSQNATGALQAQQAGNQINAELAFQILQLRQEMATQAIAGNTAQLAEQQRREAQAQVNVLFGGAPAPAGGQ